jgi:hypothetical protein
MRRPTRTPHARADAATISARDFTRCRFATVTKIASAFLECPMEATDYHHRGHKAFAISRLRGMRILSPAGRFGRLRLPPGCRPDRPQITCRLSAARRASCAADHPHCYCLGCYCLSQFLPQPCIVQPRCAPRHRDDPRDPGASRAQAGPLVPALPAESDIRAKVTEPLARCLPPWFATRRLKRVYARLQRAAATLLTMRSECWCACDSGCARPLLRSARHGRVPVRQGYRRATCTMFVCHSQKNR